jgi:hypothetical protein
VSKDGIFLGKASRVVQLSQRPRSRKEPLEDHRGLRS